MRARFRRRDARTVWEGRFGPNMTPMVDIVMVILIFFMASAAFLGEEWFLRAGVSGAPPRAGSGAPVPPADPFELPPASFTITLTRDASGRTLGSGLGLEGASVVAITDRLATLAADVSAANLSIIIAPGRDVPYQDIVTIHDACTQAGIERVSLVEAPPL